MLLLRSADDGDWFDFLVQRDFIFVSSGRKFYIEYFFSQFEYFPACKKIFDRCIARCVHSTRATDHVGSCETTRFLVL